MDCERFAAVVYEYLDSEVAYEVKIEIHEHLSRCSDCDSVVEFERRIKLLIEGLPLRGLPRRGWKIGFCGRSKRLPKPRASGSEERT